MDGLMEGGREGGREGGGRREGAFMRIPERQRESA
jgi:hypothetical protein